ncbi:Na(+) H(+) antiporter subunit B [hydrothermal vent metagenome]|uniref:Na(+) H(+) antiporter subunit B n=1 Tax=hydrothermal vent metagenome TaxID=652676 RepID=A0A3B0RJ16_9ZZZZ
MSDFTAHISPIVLLDVSLLTMLIIVAFAMLRSRHLFAVVMLSGIYSLLSAAFFVSLDAVDVAFTEAAVGAGISTVLMLGGMLLTARREKPAAKGRAPVALAVVLATGAALIYATTDMPAFGDPNAPANISIGQRYVEETPNDIAIPNIVTAVLASYRGFDTLGETMVIFTAGIAVILLLGAGSGRGGRKVADREASDREASNGEAK